MLDSSHILSVGSLNGYQLTLNQPFLIGMDMVYVPGLNVTAERFGWARLKYTTTGLQIIDQATALSGNGIIAGTTTVLPEPSTLSLIGIGAVGFFFAPPPEISPRKWAAGRVKCGHEVSILTQAVACEHDIACYRRGSNRNTVPARL